MIDDDSRRAGAKNGEAAAPDALKKAPEQDKDPARDARIEASLRGARLKASSREARLAEALRENLRRRKDAARKDRT
jgi:hypothetical protein